MESASSAAVSAITAAVAPPPSHRWFWLDVLRGVAVLLVLGRHMRSPPVGAAGAAIGRLWQCGGWVGVDLFFVLSGFLVSGLLFREHQRSGKLGIGAFYVRRALRIYPAFFIFLIVSVVLFALSGGPFPFGRLWVELFWGQSYAQGLWGHTWSLAVEEHFYLILPLVLCAMVAVDRFSAQRSVARGEDHGERRTAPHGTQSLPMTASNSASTAPSEMLSDADPFRWTPPLFGLLAAGALAMRLAIAGRPFSDLAQLFPSHLRMDSLFFGVLLSYWFHYRNRSFVAFGRRWKLALAGGGLLLLLPAFIVPVEDTFIHSAGLTLFYLGSGMLVTAAVVPAWRRIGRTPRLARGVACIGGHSYSIYLWHVVVAAVLPAVLGHAAASWPWLLQVAVYFAAAIALGMATSIAIERPIMRLRDRLFPAVRRGQREKRIAARIEARFAA